MVKKVLKRFGQLIGRIFKLGNLHRDKKVRDRESEIRKEDLTPEAVYNNYRKIAKDLIENGMDAEKVANMPIHFFLDIVESRL